MPNKFEPITPPEVVSLKFVNEQHIEPRDETTFHLKVKNTNNIAIQINDINMTFYSKDYTYKYGKHYPILFNMKNKDGTDDYNGVSIRALFESTPKECLVSPNTSKAHVIIPAGKEFVFTGQMLTNFDNDKIKTDITFRTHVSFDWCPYDSYLNETEPFSMTISVD